MKNLKEIKIDFNSLIHSIPNYLNELKKEVNLNNFIFDKDEIERYGCNSFLIMRENIRC